MKKLWTGLCAGALAVTMTVGSMVPAVALPNVSIQAASPSGDVQLVQSREDVRRLRREFRRDRREFRRDRREVRRELRRDRREDRREARRDARRDFERRADGSYYRGYRGYRTARPGYRYYNGYYFPSAAFIAGALITGAIANSQARSSGSAHVDWCYNRYRSYRASDNTYQPLSGPRRQCVSP